MRFLKRFAFAFLLAICSVSLHAEFYSSSYFGWNLDLPEGFKLKDASKDGSSFYLEHEFMKVRVAVKIFPAEK